MTDTDGAHKGITMSDVIDLKGKIISNVVEDTEKVYAKEVFERLAAEADEEEYEHTIVVVTNKDGDLKIINSDLTRAECVFFLKVAEDNMLYG